MTTINLTFKNYVEYRRFLSGTNTTEELKQANSQKGSDGECQ
jgi:hypothetical protein